MDDAFLEPLLDGLRVMTVAPELPGALELIARLASRGVAASLGHSQSTIDQARAGYAAGARSTTHLFNAMTGVDHRSPGLAVAALLDDAAYVELIADGNHVHPALWPLIVRAKPADRLVLISDALPMAGSADPARSDRRARVRGPRWTGDRGRHRHPRGLRDRARHRRPEGRRGSAGCRSRSRVPRPNPAALLEADDRGRLVAGRRAHVVELDDDLRVRRVTRGAGWIEGAGARA